MTILDDLTRPGPTMRVLATAASRVLNAWRLRALPSHRERVDRSRRVLITLRRMTGPVTAARRMNYLRQIDPLVFEELVLSALELRGIVVLRNRRYTGDGGIDGRCRMPGVGWLGIQAKRYGQHVDAEHVRAFCAEVRAQGLAGGLFVHCGRTGAMSYQALRDAQVQLVSGNTLLALLCPTSVTSEQKAHGTTIPPRADGLGQATIQAGPRGAAGGTKRMAVRRLDTPSTGQPQPRDQGQANDTGGLAHCPRSRRHSRLQGRDNRIQCSTQASQSNPCPIDCCKRDTQLRPIRTIEGTCR